MKSRGKSEMTYRSIAAAAYTSPAEKNKLLPRSLARVYRDEQKVERARALCSFNREIPRFLIVCLPSHSRESRESYLLPPPVLK